MRLAKYPGGTSRLLKICRGEGTEKDKAKTLMEPANLTRAWLLYQCVSTTADYLRGHAAIIKKPRFILYLASNHLESFMNLLRVCSIIDICFNDVNSFQSKTQQAPHIYDVFLDVLLAWQGKKGLIKMQGLALALRNIFKQFPDLGTDWAYHVRRRLRVDSPEEDADFNAALIAGGQSTTILVVEVDLLGEL